jgi:release factor glutamine methyltransferase
MNEAELLFSSMLNCDRLSLCLNKGLVLDKEKAEFISSVLKRRIKGEPIQYILGKTEFMGLEFKVGPCVLIPRPETEILVETAIRQLSVFRHQFQTLKILDVGTGSGCIAITLAKLFPNAKIDALDLSEGALAVAKDNAQLHNLDVNFIHSDLFSSNYLIANTYDLIISNPPYIVSSQIDKLQPEIKYEPRIALDGGEDGLNFYRRLIAGSLSYLKRGGLLIMETGFNQKASLKNIFQKFADFEIIETVKDHNNTDRVIVAGRKP